MNNIDITRFSKDLPKIELHAHLNGSLSAETLKSLGCLNESIFEYQKLTKLLNTSSKTLDECFEVFKLAQNATNTKENLYFATKSIIQDYFDENVIYLEIRTTPRAEGTMTKREYIDTVVKAIQDNKNNIIVKLLLSIDRRHEAEISAKSMELFIEMRRMYPNIIKGVDLSGDPKKGVFHPAIFQQAIDSGLRVSLHCAEVKNDKEVEEMLTFKPHRLGHCTNLHPDFGGSHKIWDIYCNNSMPVELCLTSNVVCGVTKDYKSHHVKKWLEKGLPFSLGTDDKGVFCTSLSEEFSLFHKNFDVSFEDMWQISYNSINYSFTSDEEKIELKDVLNKWKLKHLH